MSEASSPTSIPAEAAQARMNQALALIDFLVSAWSSNPALARKAGRKVEEFMLPRDEVQRRHAHDLDPSP